MSRSNPGLTNPASKFFRWRGGEENGGKLTYYDKEQEKEIEVALPFEFLVLDELATISGFCKPDKSGYWSNEVRSVTKDQLIVKTLAGVKETGLYAELLVRAKGAKYAQSIYIAYHDSGVLTLGNIKATGAAVAAWFELKRRYVVDNGKVVLTGAVEATSGSTTFFAPTFEWQHTTAEEDAEAIKLDKELQIYLNQYFAAANVSDDAPPDGAAANDEQGVSIDELNKVFPPTERE
jgi:hypothetical protein